MLGVPSIVAVVVATTPLITTLTAIELTVTLARVLLSHLLGFVIPKPERYSQDKSYKGNNSVYTRQRMVGRLNLLSACPDS